MSTARSVSLIPDDLGLELPGIKSRGYGAYAIASALVHSGRFNIRGRECHSYGFCAMALQDLIDDLAPTALVIPQFELDAFTVSHPASISLTDSIASLPQPKARGPIPDFAIILVRAILSTTGRPIPRGMRFDSFEHWKNVKIEQLVVGLVAEVKRRATRSATSPEEFVTSLRGHIQDARVDAVDQAAAAFLAHEGTNRLLVLAWSGEWYSWRMGVRKDFLVEAMPRRQIVSEDEAGGAHKEAEETPEANAESGAPVGPELSSEEEASVPQTATREHDGQDLDLAAHRPATTGEPELPSRASRSQEAKVEGFYTYQDPLGDVTDKKIPYNPNLNPKPRAQKSKKKSKGKGKETVETKPPPKLKKATFRRYTPGDLAGAMEMQQLLTLDECDDPNLFRFEWSDPILFGTPESNQHWSLIHGFLERENTRTFNMSNVSGNDDSAEDDSSEDEDDSDQDEDGGHNEDEDGNLNEQDGDLDDYSTESSGDEYTPSSKF